MTDTARADIVERATAPASRLASDAPQQWIALASILAGATHVVVAREHFEQWWVFGAFFVVVGCFQLTLALVILRRPTWPVALTAIVVNLGVVLVYVASRTTGLPISPPDVISHESSHAIEGVGPVDLAATGAELVVVCLLVTLLPPLLRRVTINLLLVIGTSLWALRISGALR